MINEEMALFEKVAEGKMTTVQALEIMRQHDAEARWEIPRPSWAPGWFWSGTVAVVAVVLFFFGINVNRERT